MFNHHISTWTHLLAKQPLPSTPLELPIYAIARQWQHCAWTPTPSLRGMKHHLSLLWTPAHFCDCCIPANQPAQIPKIHFTYSSYLLNNSCLQCLHYVSTFIRDSLLKVVLHCNPHYLRMCRDGSVQWSLELTWPSYYAIPVFPKSQLLHCSSAIVWVSKALHNQYPWSPSADLHNFLRIFNMQYLSSTVTLYAPCICHWGSSQ